MSLCVIIGTITLPFCFVGSDVILCTCARVMRVFCLVVSCKCKSGWNTWWRVEIEVGVFTFNRKFWFTPSSTHTKNAFSVVNVLTLTTTYFSPKTKLLCGRLIIDKDLVLSSGNKLIKVGQIPIAAWKEDFLWLSESRTYKCYLAYLRFLKKCPWEKFYFCQLII